MEAIGLGMFSLLFIGFWAGSFILWIWGIVDLARIPESWGYQQDGLVRSMMSRTLLEARKPTGPRGPTPNSSP